LNDQAVGGEMVRHDEAVLARKSSLAGQQKISALVFGEPKVMLWYYA